MYSLAKQRTKVKGLDHLLLRVMTLLLLLIGAYGATPKTAAAQATTVPLGCKASATGGDIVIPLSNDVPEGRDHCGGGASDRPQ